MLTTHEQGAVAVTVYSDLTPQLAWIRAEDSPDAIVRLDVFSEELQQMVRFRVSGRDVLRSPGNRSDRQHYPGLPLDSDGMRPACPVPAVRVATEALVGIKKATAGADARFDASPVHGPSQRVVLQAAGGAGRSSFVELVLRRRYDAPDREWRGRQWEEVDRFGPVPVADLDACWRAYGRDVREVALAVLPELVDHELYGRWFREGEAAIDAGWVPTSMGRWYFGRVATLIRAMLLVATASLQAALNDYAGQLVDERADRDAARSSSLESDYRRVTTVTFVACC